MKLYKNSDGVWAGTQVDARKMCGKGYSEVDVPTDKPSLLRFLNAYKVGANSADKAELVANTWAKEQGEIDNKVISWFAWGIDKINRGEYQEGKDLIVKGLKMHKQPNVG